MRAVFRRILSDRSGATALEYGLIAGLIAVAILLTLTQLHDDLYALFTGLTNAVNS